MSQSARDNPYAPPSSPVGEQLEPPPLEEVATRGQRFANLILDGLGSALVGIVLLTLVASVYPEVLTDNAVWFEYLFGSLMTLVYYVPCEALVGRTPAKLITGTRVVDAGGGTATFGQILGRTLARLVPFEPFSFLGGGARPAGWHDRWSGTLVVRTRGPRPLIGQYRGDGPTSPQSAG